MDNKTDEELRQMIGRASDIFINLTKSKPSKPILIPKKKKKKKKKST